MNNVMISGTIVANTASNDKLYNFRPANGDKKAVVHFLVSTQRPFAKKDENTGYYPSDLWACTAFGPTAEFINTYIKPGGALIANGYLSVDKGREKDDGTKYPDRTYICVQNAEFAPKSRNEDSGKSSVTKTATPNNLGTGFPKERAAQSTMKFSF